MGRSPTFGSLSTWVRTTMHGHGGLNQVGVGLAASVSSGVKVSSVPVITVAIAVLSVVWDPFIVDSSWCAAVRVVWLLGFDVDGGW